jgi:conjugal transfer ATP-binding protein TraC
MSFLDSVTNLFGKKEDIVQKDQTTLTLKDIISPSALKVEHNTLIMSGMYARTFFIISYPKVLTDSWLSPLINLDKVFDISMFIYPIDSATILKQFERKVAEVESQMSLRAESGKVRDPELEQAYRDLEDLRDSLTQAEEKMFDVGVYITLYGSTMIELDKAETELRTMFESKSIFLKPSIFQQAEGFTSTLPLGKDILGVHSKLNTSPLSSTFPFISFDLTQEKGILYGINRHNASLVIFDRYSMENYNSVCFARSGAGKSYTIKLELLRSMMFGVDVIVIDPEYEYKHLAEAVGGRTFSLSLSSDHHINPFDLPKVRDDESPEEVFRSHLIELVGLFRVMLGGLSPEEDALVDRAISETYALKDIEPDSNWENIDPPLLTDFQLILSGISGTENIVQKIQKYTTGSWSGFLNRPTNVDIDKQMVVFSIRDMEDDLKPVAMYLITHFIWNAVRRNIKKRLMVVDEAWWMMKSEDTASFLSSLVKRGRKYYLGISTITQDVGDFLRSPYGAPIVTNSSIQLLLKQSPLAMDLLQQTFNLTDEEKFLLLESGVGEGIFFAGLKHVAIKVIASQTEDAIITSNPEQRMKIEEEKKKLREVETSGVVN